MFALVHSKQDKGCQDEGLTSVTHTNPAFAQREHGDGIISLSNSMAATVRAQHCACEEEGALAIISTDINQTD